MPAGLIERVKSKLAPQSNAAAPAAQAKKRQSEVLGSMTVEQAQSFLAPHGDLERSLRPPPSSYQTLPLKKPASMYTSPLAKKAPDAHYVSPLAKKESPVAHYVSPLAKPDSPVASYVTVPAPDSNEAEAPQPQAPLQEASSAYTPVGGYIDTTTKAQRASKEEKNSEGGPIERAHPALGEDALAKLRGTASEHKDKERIPLSQEERQQGGWAVVGMDKEQFVKDQFGKARGGFDTVYHYDDAKDRDAHSGGSKQTTDRQDHIVELKNGRFVFAKSGAELESKNVLVPGFTVGEAVRQKEAAIRRKLDPDEKAQTIREAEAAGGRYIFVMDAQGTIYAGESLYGVQHHSSFMGGGAVAAAGELQVSGGKLTLISNMSGHYRPGAAYLWQAIQQMAGQGVDMSAVTAEIHGVGKMNAAKFLKVFDPVANPELMAPDKATKFLTDHVDKVVKDDGKTETTYC